MLRGALSPEDLAFGVGKLFELYEFADGGPDLLNTMGVFRCSKDALLLFMPDIEYGTWDAMSLAGASSACSCEPIRFVLWTGRCPFDPKSDAVD